MGWLQDPQSDAMVERGRSTGDSGEQAEIYKNLQRQLMERMVSIPLLAQTVQHAMDKCLEGFEPVPMQSFEYDFTRYH